MTISNIRDSIKRSSNNNKKRLLNSRALQADTANVALSADRQDNDNSSRKHTKCHASESPSDTNSCQSLTLRDNANKTLQSAVSSVREVNDDQTVHNHTYTHNHEALCQETQVGQPIPSPSMQQVEQCLDSIADAVQSSAAFLNKTDRLDKLPPSDFAADKSNLLEQISSFEERSLNTPSAMFSRPQSGTSDLRTTRIVGSWSSIRHSALPVMQTSPSSNSCSSTSCSEDSNSKMMVSNSIQSTTDSSLSNTTSDAFMECGAENDTVSGSNDVPEPMEVANATQSGPSNDLTFMYATGVEQCNKTVYQEAASASPANVHVATSAVSKQHNLATPVTHRTRRKCPDGESLGVVFSDVSQTSGVLSGAVLSEVSHISDDGSEDLSHRLQDTV